jgi:hypothetical protein
MDYKIADHIRTRASLVILVIDDYTNRIVSDADIQVLVEDALKPVRKSEGYYVFLNLTQTKVKLLVISDRYSPEKRSIDLSSLNPTEPIVKIRVKPSRNYNLPSGTTCLQGVAEPFSEVRVIGDSIQKYYRLLYDYDKEGSHEEIHIFNPDKSDLDGKILQIKDKDDKSEIVSVISTKDKENNIYQLEKPLENNYKKVGTKIFPVYGTKADEKGDYFIPLWNFGEDYVKCQCEMIGKKNNSKNISLEIGKVNKLSFT